MTSRKDLIGQQVQKKGETQRMQITFINARLSARASPVKDILLRLRQHTQGVSSKESRLAHRNLRAAHLLEQGRGLAHEEEVQLEEHAAAARVGVLPALFGMAGGLGRAVLPFLYW